MAKDRKSSFELAIKALDEFSGPFKKFNEQMMKSTEGVRKMGKSFKGLSREMGFGTMARSMKNVSRSFGRVTREAKSFATGVAGLAGKVSLLLGGSGGGALALTNSMAKAGMEVSKMASQAGMAVKPFQELSYAAEKFGLSAGDIASGSARIKENAMKAAQGGKEQAKWFKQAGIAIKNANGEIKTSDDLTLELADTLQRLQNDGQSGQALAIAKGIMGEEGARLMPMLQSGRAQIDDFRREFHDLGLFIDTEMIEQSKAYENSMGALKGTFKGLGVGIGKELLPIVTDLTGQFNGFIQANREIISDTVKGWLEDFKKALPGIVDGIKKFGSGVWSVLGGVNKFAQALGGWENVMVGIGAFMGSKFIASLWGVIKSIRMMSAAFMMTPIGWITVGLAGIATLAYKVYQNWDTFAAFWKGLWDEVKAAFKVSWVDGVVALFKNFSPHIWIMKGIDKLIEDLTGVSLIDEGKKFISSLGQGFQEGWDDFSANFGKKIKETVTGWIPDLDDLKFWKSDSDSDKSSSGSGKKKSRWFWESDEEDAPGGGSSASGILGPALNTGPIIESMRTSTSVERHETVTNVRLLMPEGVTGRVEGNAFGASGVYLGQAMMPAGG